MKKTLRLPAMGALLLACASTARAVDIETVRVGNAGNTDDTHGDGYGGVGYVYSIGTFEVTAGQYTDFLNAVAATDTYGLYNELMLSSDYGCKIRRTGSPGSYAYIVDADEDGTEDAEWVDRPVNYVSWGDAARFANWLHHNQPTGGQDLTTTEDGAYYLNGATSNAELMAVVREEYARWVIPSEDEWYKAAYHKNDGATGNYYDYPTTSNTAPTAEAPPGTDMINGSANYYSGGFVDPTHYRTEVGAYDEKPSDSAYRTYDQGGNVWEWNEAVIGSHRGLRGGSFYSGLDVSLPAAFRNHGNPADEDDDIGFRVADVSEYVPVPAVSQWRFVVMTVLTLTAGVLVLKRRRTARG